MVRTSSWRGALENRHDIWLWICNGSRYPRPEASVGDEGASSDFAVHLDHTLPLGVNETFSRG